MISKNSLFLSIILLPIIEIFLFIEVGKVIGSLLTIFLTMSTAFFGIYLLKIGTFRNLSKIQEKIRAGEMPDNEIQRSVFSVISAICLILPGILTDSIGFLLLLKPVQIRLIATMMKGRPNFSSKTRKNNIIDVDYKNNDE